MSRVIGTRALAPRCRSRHRGTRPGTVARLVGVASRSTVGGLLALSMAGCGGAWTAIPAEWTVDLVEDRVLGAEPVTPETAFYEPADLAFDAGNRLHVLDAGNRRVQVFAPDGTFVRTLGGPLSGPGGLLSPGGFWVFPDGEVIVADSQARRLVRYGPAGDWIEDLPLETVPLEIVGIPDRLFVLRLPRATLVTGPDTEPLVWVLTRDGRLLDRLVSPQRADAGILAMMQNLLRLAPSPDGGFALADTHVRSRFRIFSPAGRPRAEVPVLYKAGAWAPLGRLPTAINESSVANVAKTAMDLAWDPRRRLYWVLAGYVDRTPDGTWIVGHEAYRYTPEGEYRGSAVLPFPARALAAAPDGRLWALDHESVVHAFRVRDPETAATTVGRRADGTHPPSDFAAMRDSRQASRSLDSDGVGADHPATASTPR